MQGDKVMHEFELEPSWQEVLSEELKKPYITHLAAFVEQERSKGEVYPSQELIFNALQQTPFTKVRVVILGQDPYHGPGQAHGLCFSVPEGVPFPPSLKNIFKELESDLGVQRPKSGCLIPWAKQGVLLLNTTLTVNQSKPLSHHGHGWELLTDAIIIKLSQRQDPVIFVLWGKSAQQKYRHLHLNNRHPILTAPHPSPLSAYQGFFGCRHFSQINELLVKEGQQVIDWSL